MQICRFAYRKGAHLFLFNNSYFCVFVVLLLVTIDYYNGNNNQPNKITQQQNLIYFALNVAVIYKKK